MERDEPQIRRAGEQSTGERIQHAMRLNASLTDDFSPRTIFRISLYLTTENVVLVYREHGAEGVEDSLAAERRAVSFRQTRIRFAEIALPDPDGGKPLHLYLCIRERDMREMKRLLGC